MQVSKECAGFVVFETQAKKAHEKAGLQKNICHTGS